LTTVTESVWRSLTSVRMCILTLVAPAEAGAAGNSLCRVPQAAPASAGATI